MRFGISPKRSDVVIDTQGVPLKFTYGPGSPLAGIVHDEGKDYGGAFVCESVAPNYRDALVAALNASNPSIANPPNHLTQ